MTTWTGISDYLPSLDVPLSVKGEPPVLVKRLVSFHQAHEHCLVALGDRERQLIGLKLRNQTSVCHEPRDPLPTPKDLST